MGTTASPWRYEMAARVALYFASLRCFAIHHYACWISPTVFVRILFWRALQRHRMKRPGAGRSNRESIQNQRSERHRSQRSVVLRMLGADARHDRMEDRCRTNGAQSRLALCATGSAGLRLD